jgi:hypothetical protein
MLRKDYELERYWPISESELKSRAGAADIDVDTTHSLAAATRTQSIPFSNNFLRVVKNKCLTFYIYRFRAAYIKQSVFSHEVSIEYPNVHLN